MNIKAAEAALEAYNKERGESERLDWDLISLITDLLNLASQKDEDVWELLRLSAHFFELEDTP